MKKIIAILLATATLMGGVFAAAKKGTKVGVSMPTKGLQRWNQDGSNMKAQLEKAGYVVDLQFAANDIPTQVSQIENMITGKCKVLVIASIDVQLFQTFLKQLARRRSRLLLMTALS